MNQGSKPTIKDVARIAGVSRATVSRYLNGHRWVSDEAAAKIKDAIEQTHYVANTHARALVTGRAGSVALLLGEPQHLLFEDPNFATLLRALADELGQRGVSFLLMATNDKDEQRRNLAYLQAGHVDGVIQVAWHQDSSEMIADLVNAGIPTVVAEQPNDETIPVGYVHVEDFGGAKRAVEYLLERGAHYVTMISGPYGPPGARERMQAFLSVLGADADNRIAHGDYSLESGREQMEQLLHDHPDLDAVFCASDAMAVGALQTIRAHGLTVPNDVQVVGFDDSTIASMADPPLTTIRQPFDGIARHLVDQLMQLINGSQPFGVTLPCELIVRQTTR